MNAHAALRSAPAWEPVVGDADVVPVASGPALSDLLSGREEEIARLAARALSNKEIGQRLGISPWTVATHLRRIFLKLEITRRIEHCAIVAATRGSVAQQREAGFDVA